MADIVIVDNPDQDRYELRDDDGAVRGHLEYLHHDDVTVLPHTEVDPAVRGGGRAGALVRFALDDLRAHGRTVDPVCPFVERWMDRHPEYDDLRHRP